MSLLFNSSKLPTRQGLSDLHITCPLTGLPLYPFLHCYFLPCTSIPLHPLSLPFARSGGGGGGSRNGQDRAKWPKNGPKRPCLATQGPQTGSIVHHGATGVHGTRFGSHKTFLATLCRLCGPVWARFGPSRACSVPKAKKGRISGDTAQTAIPGALFPGGSPRFWWVPALRLAQARA